MTNILFTIIFALNKIIPTIQNKIIEFLCEEVKILRSKFKHRVPLTDHERKILGKLGYEIKDHLRDITTIYKPETILAWNRNMKKKKWTFDKSKKKIGRPKKGLETENLVIKLALENNWGYFRIKGEMKKLGYTVSKSYVKNILIKNNIPPLPHRKSISWKTFLKSHMDVIWATDFFTEEVWSKCGLVTVYVLFFIHLKTRRVHIAGCTPNPNSLWIEQQARNFSMLVDESNEKCKYLIHDRDNLYLPFDPIVKVDNIKIIKTPYKAPDCNAFAERFVREARETLNNMIVFGRFHLINILKKIENYHNLKRPHQGIDNNIPLGYVCPKDPIPINDIKCEENLGGLLNHYYYFDKAA